MTKRCTACRMSLTVSHFEKSTRTVDGLMIRCRECNDHHRVLTRKRYAENLEHRRAKAEYHKHRAESLEYLIARADHEKSRYSNDASYRKAKAEYYKARSSAPVYGEKRAAQERSRYANDQQYKKAKSKYRMDRYRSEPRLRVDNNVSSQIRQSLARGKSFKSWEVLVGYTLDQLVTHLESLFENGMTWDNYGEWHIDHRTPRTWFIYEHADDPAFRTCWALTNLQPKWGRLNMKKGNRYAD
jgi:hypothetical protein